MVPAPRIMFALKAIVIKYLRERRRHQQGAATDVPLTRTQSRAASLHSNRTSFLRHTTRKVGFGQRAPCMTPDELERLGSIQAQVSGYARAESIACRIGVGSFHLVRASSTLPSVYFTLPYIVKLIVRNLTSPPLLTTRRRRRVLPDASPFPALHR
jgi:hypothetical protein